MHGCGDWVPGLWVQGLRVRASVFRFGFRKKNFKFELAHLDGF